MFYAMTEANFQSYTPLLLYVSENAHSKEVVLKKVTALFPDSTSHEFLWVNEDNSSISIESVRDITQNLSFGSYQGKTRHVLMLSLEKASLQAQNALLKLLEEPPANTQIWLTTVSATNLLPTIISRCQEIVMFDTEESAEEPILILDTIEKLSHREISEFAEKYSDREEAAKLVTSLIKQVHKKVASNISKNVLVLQTLLRTKKYIAANVNVRLAVEDGLFTIKRLSQE